MQYLFSSSLILLFGLVVMVLSVTLYIKSNGFISISPRIIVIVWMLSALSLLSSAIGLSAIATKRKTKIFAFILLLAFLMNMQLIMVVLSNKIVDSRHEWLNNTQDRLTDMQKNFVQERFKCCGFETLEDRSGSKCIYKTNCFAIFTTISFQLRNYIQNSLVLIFIVESISLCILSFLKLGRKQEREELQQEGYIYHRVKSRIWFSDMRI